MRALPGDVDTSSKFALLYLNAQEVDCMSFKKFAPVPLVASIGLFVASSPANAAGLKGQLDLVWNADTTPTSIEFYTAVPNPVFPYFPLPGPADDTRGEIGDIFVTNATHDFTPLISQAGVVKDLPMIPFVGSTAKWLDFANDGFDFTLTSFVNTSAFNYTFQGFFKDGTIGTGGLTTQITGSNSKAYSVTITSDGTKIPTPALLPGLIGLGAAAWRERRQGATQEA